MNAILKASEYVEWLRKALHDKDLPSDLRTRAAASCFAIAQDHHHAIVLLLENRLYASSFSLLRIALEAYIRGAWIHLCAKEDQIDAFLAGSEPPKINLLIGDLEKMPAFSEKLSVFKEKHWKAMCDYTHTGGLHIQRWNTSEAVEPAYSIEEVQDVLLLAQTIGSLSVIGVAALANDPDLCERVLVQLTQQTN